MIASRTDVGEAKASEVTGWSASACRAAPRGRGAGDLWADDLRAIVQRSRSTPHELGPDIQWCRASERVTAVLAVVAPTTAEGVARVAVG